MAFKEDGQLSITPKAPEFLRVALVLAVGVLINCSTRRSVRNQFIACNGTTLGIKNASKQIRDWNGPPTVSLCWHLTPKIQKAGRQVTIRQLKIPWPLHRKTIDLDAMCVNAGSKFSLHLVVIHHISQTLARLLLPENPILDINALLLWFFDVSCNMHYTWSQPVLGKQNVNILHVWRIFFGLDISWLQLRSQTQNPTELLFLWPLPRDVSRQQPTRMYDFQWIASGHEQPKFSCSIMPH